MTTKRRPRPGRPRKFGAPAVNPATIDPRAVLAGIASDPETPATARVMACKALLRLAEDTETADDRSRRTDPQSTREHEEAPQ